MKILHWIGSSKKDLSKLPEEVIEAFVLGLRLAQAGKKHPKAKPLKGFGGADVIELIESDGAGTYRTVYTVRMSNVIFILHVFQKKSTQGIKTPQQEIELIKRRLTGDHGKQLGDVIIVSQFRGQDESPPWVWEMEEARSAGLEGGSAQIHDDGRTG